MVDTTRRYGTMSGLDHIGIGVSDMAASRAFYAELGFTSLLRDLPASVDPCGENGEFHTFVTRGPMLSRPIEVKAGEVVYTPPNTPHFGRNATDKESKTIVIRIKARDQPVATEVKR